MCVEVKGGRATGCCVLLTASDPRDVTAVRHTDLHAAWRVLWFGSPYGGQSRTADSRRCSTNEVLRNAPGSDKCWRRGLVVALRTEETHAQGR
jgi:hypothetical protein